MDQVHKQDDAVEATGEQLALLRELGAPDLELRDLTFAEAEEWIAELRAMRDMARQIGSA